MSVWHVSPYGWVQVGGTDSFLTFVRKGGVR